MADMKFSASRPLSPHLQIYAWSWTMAMSIAHRATGSALYLGSLLLAAWLIAAASGPAAFAQAQAIAGSWFGRLVLFGYTFALFQHMAGGLRHLIWDTGVGYGPNERRMLAMLTPALAAVLTIVAWAIGYAAR